MRKMRQRVMSLLAVAGALALSACIEESTVIKVNRDGSKTRLVCPCVSKEIQKRAAE